jgi:hypothetical protein
MTVTNKDRAEWAAAAIRHFQSLTGTDHVDSLSDLLCDLMHFSDANDFDFKAALDRARGHYAEEFFEIPPTPAPSTPYMATFNTPAGTATEIFHTNSPQEALELAQKFADDGSLTDMDIEAPAESYCVREITISDEHGQQHALWQTDEYRLQLTAPTLLQALEKQIEITSEIIDAWNNTDKLQGAVQDLIYALESQSECAKDVLDAWQNGELAGSLDGLEKTLSDAIKTVAQAKGGAA